MTGAVAVAVGVFAGLELTLVAVMAFPPGEPGNFRKHVLITVAGFLVLIALTVA